MIPKFDEKELQVVSTTAETAMMPSINILSYPISARENYISTLKRKPYWQVIGVESQIFTPRILPDNVARAFVLEAAPFDAVKEGGGPDMFGIEWEYIAQVGGSMVRPGKPLLEDANEWVEKVVWPDIEKWDWEGSAKINNGKYFSKDKLNNCWFQNGWYERLISFMDFEGAIVALIDEDQKDAVTALFTKLTDLYIKIFDKFIDTFPEIDCFFVHDDWGYQKETFFSPAVCAEMIVPHMRRLTDHIHARGKLCELHSCGQLMKQVPNMIAAGWDSWSGQAMNDMQKIYELYGDKIMLGVSPDEIDINNTTEEEQRAAARDYADKFCNPAKPSFMGYSGARNMSPAYREELYKQSRINYSK